METHHDGRFGNQRGADGRSGGDLVIDVGCGDGAPLDHVGDMYRAAVGFDISSERFSRRTDTPGQWSFVLADLNRGIPVASGAADAVHANQVIEHLANPLQFAEEVWRVLRPGGVLVAMTPNVRYVPHVWRLVVRGPRSSDVWRADAHTG